MFADCEWITDHCGVRTTDPSERWNFGDSVVENGYQRTFIFKHQEDYAAFVLSRG